MSENAKYQWKINVCDLKSEAMMSGIGCMSEIVYLGCVKVKIECIRMKAVLWTEYVSW